MKRNNPVIPIKTYNNADISRSQILLENKNLSGVYL